MGTAVAANYANLFMDMFKTSLLNDFHTHTHTHTQTPTHTHTHTHTQFQVLIYEDIKIIVITKAIALVNLANQKQPLEVFFTKRCS